MGSDLCSVSWPVLLGLAIYGAYLHWQGKLRRRTNCPDCGEPFPMIRKPANREQAMQGGATCQKCGCEVDRHGQKIRKPRNPFDDGSEGPDSSTQ